MIMARVELGPEELAGLMMAFGFHGYDLSDEHAHMVVEELGVPNIILFNQNMSSPKQVADLVRRIDGRFTRRGLAGALIMTDQEGGMVLRMPRYTTPLPGNMALGAIGRAEEARQAGLIIGSELAAMGINLDLAPVLDVLVEPESTVIGERSFGQDPALVSKLGRAFIDGLHRAGVGATAKHFPGHGATILDSHYELPRISLGAEELEAHLRPFRDAVRAGVDAVMMGHILVDALDPRMPASLSPRAVEALRNTGFKGLVISDCMEMQAVSARYTPEEIVDLAVKAGLDLILFSHTPSMQRRAYDRMLRLIIRGDVDEERILSSIARREELVARYRALRSQHPLETVGSRRHLEDCVKLACRALTVLKGCRDAAARPERLLIAYPPRLDTPSPVAGEAGAMSPCSVAAETGLDAECVELEEGLRDDNALVLFYSKRDLPRLPSRGWMLVALGNPVWLRYAPLHGYSVVVAAYSYRYCSLKALFLALKGLCHPKGRLPIDINGIYEAGYGCPHSGEEDR